MLKMSFFVLKKKKNTVIVLSHIKHFCCYMYAISDRNMKYDPRFQVSSFLSVFSFFFLFFFVI